VGIAEDSVAHRKRPQFVPDRGASEICPNLPQGFNNVCTDPVAIVVGKDSSGHYFPIANRS
jgi:hypothetical protein